MTRVRSYAVVLALALSVTGLSVPSAVGLPLIGSTSDAIVDPEVLDLVNEGGPQGDASAFVHFAAEVDFEWGMAMLGASGLRVAVELPAAHAAYAWGPGTTLLALAERPEVVRLEAPGLAEQAMNTAPWATRSTSLYTETGGLDLRVEAPDGGYVDGSGVGVAIVDSGIDATNPDLAWCGAPGADQQTCQTVLNFKVACSTPILINVNTGQCFGPVAFVDVPDSDTTSGHGTHVAGTAAGSGVAGDGRYAGVAPGAKLYGFGSGEGLSIVVLNAAASLQWIYDHGLAQDPPIRVVNNSYGGAGDYDERSVINKLATALVEERDITVVFAAGNSGGNGSTVQTSSYGNNPNPGVIQVANYNDANTGTRNGDLSGTSSRGHAQRPETWPDLAAPGTFITSTCKVGTVACSLGPQTNYPPHYGNMSGTSMAAPHVTGAISFLYQADPDITPARVRELLTSTAYKFSNAVGYAEDGSSFDKGHGLLDARAAILELLEYDEDPGVGASSRSADGRLHAIATGEAGDHPVGALDLTGVSVEEIVDPDGDDLFAVRWELRDASDTGAPAGSVEYAYRLFSNIDGDARRLQVGWDGQTVRPVVLGGDGAEPVEVGIDGNTLYALYSASVLGIDRGAVLFDVWAASYAVLIQDRSPGRDVPTPDGLRILTDPKVGKPYVFVGLGYGTDRAEVMRRGQKKN